MQLIEPIAFFHICKSSNEFVVFFFFFFFLGIILKCTALNMTWVLVACDSMVKYAAQYFPSCVGLSVSIAVHRGIRIEYLLSMIAGKLMLSSCTLALTMWLTVRVSVCMDRYHQLGQEITERNPMAQVAFSAILPRRQDQHPT